MHRHAIRAFVVAPLVAPIIAFVLLSFGAYAVYDFPETTLAALAVTILVALVSYAHAITLGLPLALILLRRGVPSLATSALCGALVGSLPMSVLVAVQEVTVPLNGAIGASRLSISFQQIFVCAICGMLSGIVWRLKVNGADLREKLNAA